MEGAGGHLPLMALLLDNDGSDKIIAYVKTEHPPFHPLPYLMASQKLPNCGVALHPSSLRRTNVRLIPLDLRALHLELFA
jgi:hypothetical protein